MAIRFVLLTIDAAGIDSIVFTTIAFSTSFGMSEIITMTLNIGLIKVCIEILGLPVSVRISKALKRSLILKNHTSSI